MREIRKFGFSLGLAMNVMGAIMFYRGRGHFIWFTGIGSLNLILAILCPTALIPLKKALDLVILLIGRTVNGISLVFVFYFIFAPIGILLRLFGRDLLRRRIDKTAGSYWIKRQGAAFTADSYERMG